MRKIIFVGKLNNKKELLKNCESFQNKSKNVATFISDTVVFRTSGCGHNFEIRELIAENGLVFRKHIPI